MLVWVLIVRREKVKVSYPLREKHSFILFLWDISCPQLHSHIPFPASVCTMNSGQTPLWVLGTQGGQWISFRLQRWKRHTAAGFLPRLQHWFYTVVLFHTDWINGRRQKDNSSFFSLCPEDLFFFFFCFLKVQTSEGKWPLTSPI